MAKTLTIVPAYGRDYKNEAEARKAWVGGYDFLTQSYNLKDTYVSIRDSNEIEKLGFSAVSIRYNRKLSQLIIPLDRPSL